MTSISLDDRVLEAAVAEAVEPLVGPLKPTLSEAYVPQSKPYRLSSERLSETSRQRHEEIYKSYVEALARTSLEVDAARRQDSSTAASQYRNVKRDETWLCNAVHLHELFFANCFSPGSELFQDMITHTLLARDFGTFDDWTKDFVACAMAARDGWAICCWSLYLKRFVNVAIDGHDSGLPSGMMPAIVLDVQEHAYSMDYGNDRRRYVYAVMGEIDWDVVDARVAKIVKLKEIVG